MSQAAGASYNEALGDDVTTVFAPSFDFTDNSELVVAGYDSTTGEFIETYVITTDYTLTGNPATQVTFLTAPATGVTIRLSRNTARTQPNALNVGDTYKTATIEAALDKLTRIAQELTDEDEQINLRVDNYLTNVLAAQAAAEAAQAAAEAAQTAAETAQTNAETAETNAVSAQNAAQAAQAAAEAAQIAAETARDETVYDVQGTVLSPTLVDGLAQVPLTGVTRRHFIIVEGDGGAVDQSSVNPQIDPPTNDGDELTLVGNSNTNTVKFVTGNGLVMNGDYIMVQNSMISFIGVNSIWVEKSRNNI